MDAQSGRFTTTSIACRSLMRGKCVTSVVTTAISIPIMPKRLPVRLVAGEDRPRSARMKNTPDTR